MDIPDLLSHPAISRWHDNIADMFDYQAEGELAHRISTALNNLVEHQAFILKLYPADSIRPAIISHNIPAHLNEIYICRYLSFACLNDPVLEYLHTSTAARVVQVNQHTSGLRESSYYHSYYQYLTFQDEIDMIFPMENGDTLVFSIGRRKAVSTAAELKLLDSISGLLKRVLRHFHKTHIATRARPLPEPAGEKPALELLTARESQIVQLMIAGNGTKNIAKCLSISFQTVKVHRRNIYAKLGINSELQLCSMLMIEKNTRLQPAAAHNAVPARTTAQPCSTGSALLKQSFGRQHAGAVF